MQTGYGGSEQWDPELYSMALVIFRTSFYGVWMEEELVTKVHTMGESLD